MPTFIGIDLAWRSDRNHSGGAVLEGDEQGVTIKELSEGLTTLNEVQGFIHRHTRSDCIVAIDAPLIIENDKGQRPCEKKIGHQFGAAHASAHTSNRKLYPDAGSVRLVNHLKAQGFEDCPHPHQRFLGGKWFFEVYPHPAHLVLFQRSQIIKYKKGQVTARKKGLHEFRESMRRFLCQANPSLVEDAQLCSFLERPLGDLRGKALKRYEDLLDAVFCAYLAAYFWTWSWERNEMIGNRETGYVINPIQRAANELMEQTPYSRGSS